MLSSRGEIAAMLSLPKISCMMESCWALGSCLTASRTLMMAAGPSFCICWASLTVSMPSLAKASFWPLVAASPDVRLRIRFLMPVAAISGLTFMASRVAAKAVMGLAATPPTLPRGPMRRTTSAIPFSVADVVLANWFMRSSMLRVSGMLRCMAVR